METIYRKVSVRDRLPEFSQRVIALVLEQNDLGLSKFLWSVSYSDIMKSFKMDGNTVQIEYWLEEIPETIKSDNTETLANALHRIEKLKEDKKELMSLLYDCKIVIDMHRQIHGFVGASEQLYEDIESLIQKMKQ